MGEDNYSLSSRVFHTIRENILSGKYATDEELKEKNIGEELGVSRTPVREALRQLELEGLVTIIPNKGAYVVGISKKDIQDIYEIRSRLEGLCAKWAADKITKEQLDELDENIYLSDFHAAKGNSEQVVELVFERKLLRPGGLLIFEHSKERSFEGHPALLQVRTYGSVHFSVFRMPDVE